MAEDEENVVTTRITGFNSRPCKYREAFKISKQKKKTG